MSAERRLNRRDRRDRDIRQWRNGWSESRRRFGNGGATAPPFNRRDSLGFLPGLLGSLRFLRSFRERGGLKRERSDIGEKRTLVLARQTLDGGLQRQPVDRPHIVRQVAGRPTTGFHPPIMNDLGSSTQVIGQRSQKFMHRHIVAGFLPHFAHRRIARRFAVVELALGKNPFALAQTHHRDQRRPGLPQHNTSRCQNWRSRHLFPLPKCRIRSTRFYISQEVRKIDGGIFLFIGIRTRNLVLLPQ